MPDAPSLDKVDYLLAARNAQNNKRVLFEDSIKRFFKDLHDIIGPDNLPFSADSDMEQDYLPEVETVVNEYKETFNNMLAEYDQERGNINSLLVERTGFELENLNSVAEIIERLLRNLNIVSTGPLRGGSLGPTNNLNRWYSIVNNPVPSHLTHLPLTPLVYYFNNPGEYHNAIDGAAATATSAPAAAPMVIDRSPLQKRRREEEKKDEEEEEVVAAPIEKRSKVDDVMKETANSLLSMSNNNNKGGSRRKRKGKSRRKRKTSRNAKSKRGGKTRRRARRKKTKRKNRGKNKGRK